MAAPRFDGRGFNNPLNPLSLHSENHYRDESPIGSSFMSDEKRVFGLSSGVIKSRAKGGSKAGAKIGAKAGAKAAAKASQKAFSKASSSITKAAGSKLALRGVTVGIPTIGAFYAIAGSTGLGTKTVDELTGANCPEKVKAMGLNEGTEEYKKALEECYGGAARNVAMIGTVVAVSVVALIGVLILKR